MATFGKFKDYLIIGLAVLFGGGSLILFLVFLLADSPELMSLNLGPNKVLWWDTELCIAFFFQHSGMVRKSFRQRLARSLSAEYEGAVYAIASGIALLLLMVLWQKSALTLTAPGCFPLAVLHSLPALVRRIYLGFQSPGSL